MTKMDSFVYLRLLPELWSLECQKWLILCTFCWKQQKISPSLGKIFRCIWKVLFSPVRKCYGLWSSELPLARRQHLKIQDFTIPLLTQHFFFFFWIFLPTISHEQLSPKPINHTIFCKNAISSSRFT